MDNGDQVKETLRGLHGKFLSAFRDGNYDALTQLYAENAVMLPPNSDILVGRDHIIDYWQQALRYQDLEFEMTEVRATGADVIRDVGKLQALMRGEGRQTRQVSSKYMFLWVRSGSEWKLDTSVWNGTGQGGRGGGGGGRGRGPNAAGGPGGGGGGGRPGRGGGRQGGVGGGGGGRPGRGGGPGAGRGQPQE